MTRWNRRLLFGAIAVLVPALAGCEAGFNAPTLEFHPANFGVDTVQNNIIIDNAFVLGPTPGTVLPPGGQAGVFLSIQAQNGDRLVSVSAPGAASAVRIDGGSVNLPAQSAGGPERPGAEGGAHRADQPARRRGDGPAEPHLRRGGDDHT